MQTNRTCPQCQQTLRPDAPDGLCPECLFKVGMGSVPRPRGTIVIGEELVRERELPMPGAQFGGYRILRELGRGGMGAVYEAEHLESGRRVALKVLGHRLDSMEDRARFLREGRLAGSINHPNSVYVFGTEEIDGTPVIAMELIAGGTLQERVERRGPLAVGEAVDAILQVIAGLEAAQAIGILHRDIKPANCFEDADGLVKVGDFGLSISTVARGETNITMEGLFLGTPAFCSPEQLRGEELNVRSDMYSVGVTLFYLLTGRTPFEGKNMVQLLANVIEKPAPSAKQFRANIPLGLANAVSRCLQKQPGERFRNYDELRQALAPFSSDAPVPAPLALRFFAGVIDTFLISGTTMFVSFLLLGDLASYTNPASYRSPKMLAGMAAALVTWMFYYALLEGIRGAGLGKAIFRLRVAGPDRNPPGVPKALARAGLFLIVPALPYWLAFVLDPMGFVGGGGTFAMISTSLAYYALIALLFSTVRQRNGFAALHDMLTNTRVVRRTSLGARPVLSTSDETSPSTESTPKVGPFHVIETLEKAEWGEWLLGYDTRLLRKVWIRIVAPGTPSIAPALRGLGRIGRVRWITGRRSPEENWDVFEGLTGKPLLKLSPGQRSWSHVRFWLLDLANEIGAAGKDGTQSEVLSLDRVWITAGGRAKLLDFPAPGVPAEDRKTGAPPMAGTSSDGCAFLSQVAAAALGDEQDKGMKTPPLPLHARSFLDKLPAFPNVDVVASTLKPLIQRVATVSRLRRAGVIGGCIAFPLLASLGFMGSMKMVQKWQRAQPDIAELSGVLNHRMATRLPLLKTKRSPDDRTFAIFIASHYGRTITNVDSWTTLYAASTIAGDNRRFAEQSVAEHPNPTEKEIKDASAAVKPFASAGQKENFAFKPWFAGVVCGVGLILYVGIPALLAALLFRGGLVLLACGVAVANRDGSRASRWRVLWRSLVAWAPLLIAPLLLLFLVPAVGIVGVASILVALASVLSIWSISLPERSLQDRIAGTWLVPR